MATLTRGDVLTLVKYWLKESSATSLTYSAAELNAYFYEALKSAVKETRWPPTTKTGTWPISTSEISLPDGTIEIHRVLINGQRIRPTTIPTEEEDAARVYDASWTVEDDEAIPALDDSSDSSLAVLGTPDFRYYIRGNKIGIIPAGSAAYAYILHGLFEPANPGNDTTALDLYLHHETYISYKVMFHCLAADKKMEEAIKWLQLAKQEAMETLRWAKQLQGDEETHISPLPYRSHWGR